MVLLRRPVHAVLLTCWVAEVRATGAAQIERNENLGEDSGESVRIPARVGPHRRWPCLINQVGRGAQERAAGGLFTSKGC